MHVNADITLAEIIGNAILNADPKLIKLKCGIRKYILRDIIEEKNNGNIFNM